MDNVSVWMDSLMMVLMSVNNVTQFVTLVLAMLMVVPNVPYQELMLHIVDAHPENSVMKIKVNMNANTVHTNVTPVKKKPKPVSFVLKTELMLQTVLVHQVISMNQKIPSVPDVPKNVKNVPTVDHVPPVMLQESMLHTVTAHLVNSKFVELKVKFPVILNAQTHNVTIVTINVSLVPMLLMLVILVPVTESLKPVVDAQ
jgi:hypothetical protein